MDGIPSLAGTTNPTSTSQPSFDRNVSVTTRIAIVDGSPRFVRNRKIAKVWSTLATNATLSPESFGRNSSTYAERFEDLDEKSITIHTRG
jgi:hypothetical protein